MPSLSVFIPAYNAERHLTSVIKRIPDESWDDILSVWIINDGSMDQTAAVIDALIGENPKIKKITFPANRGYGQAVKAGLAAIKKESPDYAICLHADGQYPPEVIPQFLAVAEAKKYDVLQGSRLAPGTARQGGMPLYKYAAGKILTFLENKVFGLALTDYHSGYLWYSRRAFMDIPFDNLSDSFDFDVEMIASAKRRGLRIGETGIPTRYADEVSYLNPIMYGLRIVGVMIKYVMGKYD